MTSKTGPTLGNRKNSNRSRNGHERNRKDNRPTSLPAQGSSTTERLFGDVTVDDVISSLPAVEGVDLNEVGRRYATALPRVLAKTPSKLVLLSIVGTILALVWIGRYSVMEIAEIDHSQTPLWGVFLLAAAYALILCAMSAFVVTILRRHAKGGYLASRERQKIRDAFTKWAVIYIVALAMLPLLALILVSLGYWNIFGEDVGYYLTWASIVFMLPATAILDIAIDSLAPKSDEHHPLEPLDRVGTRLVAIAVSVNACTYDASATTSKRVRSLVGELELLARDAERFATPRTAWWDRDMRQAALLDGLRLAVVIRAHKRQLVAAISSEDFAAIARSLTGGASAWARRDLATMVRDAPNVSPPRMLKTLLTRLLPTILLGTLAIVIPLLPPLNQVAQAASGFRTALLIAAALSLVTGTTHVPDYVRSAIEKSILSK